jgi:ligand-binding sensor domain-containing protein
MKISKIIIAIFFGLFVVSCSEKTTGPTEPGDQWIVYTTSDGLPSDAVGAIAFGPDGNLWCVPLVEGGTGVAHYDGNDWKHYTMDDGLGNNAILWMENTLAVSSEGDVWVATFGGGISCFNGQTWKTYTTDDGLLANQVTAVCIAPDGDLWCAHAAPVCGLSHFDGINWTVYTPRDMGLSSCNLISLAMDSNGTLWAGGDVVLHFDSDHWTRLSSETGMQQPIALYMDIGPDGNLWIAGSGVSCYDGTAWTHHSLEDIGAEGDSETLMPIAVDSENVVWIGVTGKGVFKYNGEDWQKLNPKGAPDLKSVFSITIDEEGAIWFGTENGILCYQSEDQL